MINIEEAIKELEGLKKQWDDKYTELFSHVRSYVGDNDAEYITEFQHKLDELSSELRALGKKYHQKVDRIADDIVEDHKDNPIIKSLMEGFKSDIVDDYNYNVYHGNREAHLKDLAEIIEMFDKMS